MAWYHWNSSIFWALRNVTFGLEQINGIRGTGLSRSETPEYAYLHLLSKDLIQAGELLGTFLKMIAQLKTMHEKSIGIQTTTEHHVQTASALDYHILRFEGLEARIEALLKRMNNQISLVRILILR